MDTKEHLNILDQCIGHKMSFEATTILDNVDVLWKGLGEVVFSATRDGKNWGKVVQKSMTYDRTPQNAVATIIATAMSYADSEDFLIDLFKSLVEAEAEDNVKELTEVTAG